MDTLLLSLLAALAGALTSIAGSGGGMLLLLGMSLTHGPAEALAVTSPALLLGNLHRLAVHRRALDRRVAGAFALGAVPGSVVGGLLVLALPPLALQLGLVLAAGFALAHGLGLLRRRPPRGALAPAGFVIGAAAATSGGAGLLVGPLLLTSGLTGAAYLGTVAAAAVAMHVGRIAAYGAGGLVTADRLELAAVLAAAILAGNAGGERVRRRLDPARAARLELGVLLVCVALAVLGLA
jgi:hypothetical protein